MNRQTLQHQHRSVARVERAVGLRVPSRAELAAAHSQAQVVVQQTVSQAKQTVAQCQPRPADANRATVVRPVATVQPPRSPIQTPPHVTLDSIATPPQPAQRQVLRPAMAVAASSALAMAVPMSGTVTAKTPKLSNKMRASRDKVLNIPVVKKTIGTVKIGVTKFKNNPKVRRIQAKIPNSVKNIKIHPAEAIRYGVVAACLVVAGFLAYDTWQTNQQIQSVFSPEPAAAAVETPPPVAAEPTPPADNGDEDGGGGNNRAFPDYVVAADMPRVLSIPVIGVWAKVLPVGLTAGNQVGTPTSMWDAGWYDGSTLPGKAGAAFVAGHYNVGGGGGVFDNLKALNNGDDVYIELGDGQTIRYSVYNRETIPVEQVDMSAVLAAAGDTGEGLNLMTCAGQFTRNGFTHRTIVYAKRV